MKKELSDFQKDGQSAFFALTKNLAATTAIAMFAGNSSAMRAGVEGRIESIDYETVGGANTPPITQDQIVNIDGNEVVLVAYSPDEKRYPKAVTIRLDNGITMTLGLLLQGQEKTTVHFAGDAAPTKSTDITVPKLATLVGKKIKCNKYWRDASNTIVRGAQGNNAERSYAANCYEIVQLAD